MDIKKVKEVAEMMKKYELTSIEIEDGDNRIAMSKGGDAQMMAAPVALPQMQSVPVQEAFSPKAPAVSKVEGIEIKAPMVGTFYRSPSPTAQPFVEVGTKIKQGDVLCIIEAMKLMNEIKAEVSGEIIDICVENGDPIEFGQVLFRIK